MKIKESALHIANNTLAKKHQESGVTHYDRTPKLFGFITNMFSGKKKLRILSYGCSTGEEVFTLAEIYCPDARIIGIDINELAIKKAKQALNLRPNIKNRVNFYLSEDFEAKKEKGFDIILAHSVLCRWPDTKDSENISNIYPHQEFADTINSLVFLLNKGGVLSLYNANYDPATVTNDISPINCDIGIGLVHRYFPDGSRIPEDELGKISVLFSK